jgi:polyadenylate-binding protein
MSQPTTTDTPAETPIETQAAAPAPSINPPSASGPPDGTPQPFHSASLYVGDLINEVNEGLLFEIFNAVGPVSSIRVCRDAVTRRSLGYAYVNFHQIADAERALDTMNYTDIKGKPCRIMWSQRDPSLRRSGVGNIFVKNLNESIDNKQLYDTFSLFGNILSCKVVTDRETGNSKGYGYVHYETAEAAHAAIDKLDGMLIDGQEVQVGEFMRRNDRPGQNEFTNLYVKNIPYEWDDAKFKEEFAKYGEIVSASISKGTKSKRRLTKKKPVPKKEEEKTEEEAEAPAADATKEATEEKAEKEAAAPVEEKAKEETAAPVEEQKDQSPISLGYGFVNFLEHEAALLAVENLDGKVFETEIDGEMVKQELFVGRAQKKSERERELHAKYEAEKMDRIAKFQGVNLYVKNLDETVSDDLLRDEFATMGTITSARVMKDLKTGRPKGFGFVCYSTPEEATRAVNEMNGKILGNKPIFVALAQRRDVRRAQLEAQHAQRAGPGQVMGRGPMGGPMGYPNMPMYRPGPGGSMQPAYPMMPQMMGGPGRGGNIPGRGYPMMQQPRGYPGMPYQGGMSQQVGRGGGRMQGGRGRGRGMQGGRGSPQNGGRGSQQGIKFNQQARNAGASAMPPAPMPQQQAPPPAGNAGPPPPAPNEALTAAALASATPEMQKNMIGERLYPLIHMSQPDLAGKITGMLLEMDNSELLHLLESPEALGAKISEALQVLEAHQGAES